MTKTHTHTLTLKTFIVSAFEELAKEKNKSIKFSLNWQTINTKQE